MNIENNIDNWLFEFCPEAPNYKIDWPTIENTFNWLKNMKGIEQNPFFHAEGDVFIHTKLVCESLVKDIEWQKLDNTGQSIIFLAAMLHDVAKPLCTKVVNGQIRSSGHSEKGELLARELLYSSEYFAGLIPFKIREVITKLVLYHMLPLKFLNRENPEREIIKASQLVRLDWVYILSKADIFGREANDRTKQLEKIDLFKTLCIEHSCFTESKGFPDAYSRFIYFNKNNTYPEYEAYDDTKFTVTLLAGLPGAGKDTWLNNHCRNLPTISLDNIRMELNIKPDEKQGAVIQYAKELARKHMRLHQSFVWNATNVTKDLRSTLINLFLSYGAKIKIVYVESNYKDLILQNNSRKNPVPEKIIKKLIRKLQVPDITEAHEIIYVV